MKEQFDLSKRIFPDGEAIGIESVKEFIRLLKEEIKDWLYEDIRRGDVYHLIDKLAGSKLSEEK